jgi:Cu(I)/Ag(I) efflux system membrane fusion protein
MKIIRPISFFFLLSVFVTVYSACNQNGNKKVSDTYNNPDNVAGRVPETGSGRTTEMGVDTMLQSESMVFKDILSPAFKDKFVQLVDAYLKMKDGFVADNEKEVDKQATMMLTIINSMPDSLLKGEALNYWKEKKGFLLAHLKLYKEAEKDKDKRLNFVFLSTVMVKSVKALGYNKPLYVDYCPMANNDKGAYWLSQIKDIQNPYLGQKMPNCGEIKKVL